MILLTDVISEPEIQSFKKYFEKDFHRSYVNWTSGDRVIDHRVTIAEDSPEFDVVRRIVTQNFAAPAHMWAAYQRQTQPHQIHIDDYASTVPGRFRYTYILAMDSVPEFKTIIWKPIHATHESMHQFVADWGRLRRFQKKISNISQTEDLEHTYDENQQDYLCDYMELDAIYTYQAGTACLFNAHQVHCTSNWLKYNRWSCRELLQIHVLNNEPIEC